MLTPQQRQQFQQADSDLDGLTAARLDDLLSVLSVSNPLEFKAGVLDTVPGLVAELSDVSALISADMYETAREQAEVRGRFTVDLADPPPVEQVEASSRWALGPLFQAESTLTFAEVAALVSDRLGASATRLVRDGGRRTVTDNTARDPSKPRYRRVASATGCEFCQMLASRGAVYLSEDRAGSGRHFHDRCSCYVDLIFN